MTCDISSLLYEKVMIMLSSRLRLLLKAVELTKVAWEMPRVHPNDVNSLVCTKASNQRLSWTLRFECVSVVLLRYPLKRGPLTGPEKPRHVLIAFQFDRSGDQDKNPSLFDHLSATQVSV